jgi:hypothetical protein
MLQVEHAGATYSEALGGYRLSVRGVPGDTLALLACDGFVGGHCSTRAGSVRVVLHQSLVEVDIVLDRVNDI